ncbi:cytochrome P450 [Nocardia sp. 2]|uniref:Cytochrome P450 n=1 Tax=Nocardia acididurans TaxID=2802282 RepID=A0ABS1M1W2_9NOCA|nr:cytochrome P450 [Nocardia acididurans]MBL1074491.1 cytochrome P450 [Nocardia acididurans]
MTLIGTDHSTSTRTAPTAPGALPLLGHWPRFGRRPYRFLSTLSAVGPVVRVRIPGYDTYVVTDPELVREAFVALSDQGMMIERAEALLGEGVTVLQGQRHRRERRMIAPAFAKARIARYAEVMTRLGAQRAESWRAGQVLAVNEQMHDLALRTVAGALFTGELGAETAEHIHRLLPPVMTLLSRRVTRPAWIDRLPLPGNRRFDALVAEMKAATGAIITAYRAELAADPDLDHGDLLDTLLKARDENGDALTDSQVHDELINFLVGGTEAIGATLAWVFHELAVNPEVERALHAELDAVLENGRAAEFTDLARLDVTKRVVLETLRKYSPWLTVRHVPETYVLGGVEIPSGSMLFVCPVAVHRDPAIHPDPLRFDPDRWLPDRMAELSRGAHIPFGMGARQCPGNIFALTEIALQVATLGARWRLRPMPGIPVRETVIGALVHPQRLPMQVEARRP